MVLFALGIPAIKRSCWRVDLEKLGLPTPTHLSIFVLLLLYQLVHVNLVGVDQERYQHVQENHHLHMRRHSPDYVCVRR